MNEDLKALSIILEQMRQSEIKLDRKCERLSDLCSTLLSGMRNLMSHDTMSYDDRKKKKESIKTLIARLDGTEEGEDM